MDRQPVRVEIQDHGHVGGRVRKDTVTVQVVCRTGEWVRHVLETTNYFFGAPEDLESVRGFTSKKTGRQGTQVGTAQEYEVTEHDLGRGAQRGWREDTGLIKEGSEKNHPRVRESE